MAELYLPHKKQIEAHTAVEQFVGYGGAMGGGKTRWLCETVKILSIDYPGNFGFTCRASGPALRETVLETMFTEVLVPGSSEWEALGCKFNRSEGILTFTRIKRHGVASKIWFSGLDNMNLERLKSLNLGFFAIEEATEVSESIFMMLMTRLRRKHIPRVARKGLVTANPEAGWLKKRFVDQKLPNHKFVFANFKDNPYLPEDYASLFDTMPERWRQKYLIGSWEAASGLIYKEFDEDFHIIPYTQPKKWWKIIRCLDHGQQNPTACLALASLSIEDGETKDILGEAAYEKMNRAYDDYPVIIGFRLYYSPGLVSAHRKRIAHVFKDVAVKPHPIFADPSIWSKDREVEVIKAGQKIKQEASIADEYQQKPYPLRGLQRANNYVNAGIDRVSTLLKVGHLFFMNAPDMQPLIGVSGEIRNYSWKEPPRDDENWPEQPIKKDDHACDALRYGVMSFPSPSPKEQKFPMNTFAKIRAKAISYRKRTGQITGLSRIST